MLNLDLPPFYTSVVFESLDGSNAEAKRRAQAGADEGLFVLTEEQLAGRGRRGRDWSSPKGNLYCSILLKPLENPKSAALVSFVAALAVSDLVLAAMPVGSDVALKWPNDVLLDGKKISGILLESTASNENKLDWLIVGMGINLRHSPKDTEPSAISIADNVQDPPEVDAAAELLADRFLFWLTTFRADGFKPIREAWLGRASGLEQKIRVQLPNETLYGIFRGLDDNGALELEEGSTIRRITAGEVFFGSF